MCVAATGIVTEVRGQTAVVDFGGARTEARMGLTTVAPGDRVLVHAGCILQKVREEKAAEDPYDPSGDLTELMRELGAY